MQAEKLQEVFAEPGELSLPVGEEADSSETSKSFPPEGRQRVAIENVSPLIDGGRYAIKRTIGERVVVEADLFADSHVLLSAALKYRSADALNWKEVPMTRLTNDRWRGEFTVDQLGIWFYTVVGWVDRFKSWRDELRKKMNAGQDVKLDLATGGILVEEAAKRVGGAIGERLNRWAAEITAEPDIAGVSSAALAFDEVLGDLVMRSSERLYETVFERELRVIVDPERARFSAWYELFPRSCSKEPGRHGTFKDCEEQLPRIAEMGFDVLYLPPIHPIGNSFRKGKNNQPTSQPNDPGSPWAIGAAEGGHKAVHPQLGTLEDFKQLVKTARSLGLDVALDIAFQCSPDHAYLKEHPEWFHKRPDGSIAYAENPPKKYQDIYPFDFECPDWRNLWIELKSVFEFWIEQGIRIFRVDNPHTKSFAFWEWCLGDLKSKQPDLIFLAEAFTRPAVLCHWPRLDFRSHITISPGAIPNMK